MKHKIKHKIKHCIIDQHDVDKKRTMLFVSVLLVSLGINLVFIQENIDTKGQEDIETIYYNEEKNSKEEEKRIEINNAYKEIEEIDIMLHDILGDEEKYYGIYYCDLNTEVEYSLNANNEFHAASTIKVPIAMMVSDKLYNKELNEKTLIEYEDSDNSDGAGILQGEIKTGDKKEVWELMQYMIEESDNIATSMLKKNLGSISDYIVSNTGIVANNNENYITPKQSYLMLKKLYKESKDNVYYKKVIQLMKETSSHDRIDKYIPNNIVAHKIGDYDKYVNDISIVYLDSPYILVIYTKDVMEKGRENIAQISKNIYEIKNAK